MKPTPATCALKVAATEMAKSAAKSCGCPPVRLTTTSLIMTRTPSVPHQSRGTGPVQVCRAVKARLRALLLLAVRVELLEVVPERIALRLVAHAGKGHAGAGDLLHRIADVFLELCIAPGNAGILDRVRIVVAGE